MKTLIASCLLAAMAAYAFGVKTKELVLKNIYLPLINSTSKKAIDASYKQVLCPKDGITLATFGQSNSANFVIPLATNTIPKKLCFIF